MKQQKNILIIGYGFVGKACAACFPDQNCVIVDPAEPESHLDVYPSVQKVPVKFRERLDAVFVCVPTPMAEDGSMNSKILFSVLDELKTHTTDFADTNNDEMTIIIKSTVLPDTFSRIKFFYYSGFTDRIVYNPEFLTERNAVDDMINADLLVLGGEPQRCDYVEQLYMDSSLCRVKNVHKLTPEEASFVKYGINSFLASKIIWFNEYMHVMRAFGEKVNANRVEPSAAIKAMLSDSRIGDTHTNQPGPDGREGFGGACFPKDTNALLTMIHNLKLPGFTSLDNAVNVNQMIRSRYELDDREKEQNVKYN